MKITKPFTPSNSADWRKWLAKNHNRELEVWLVYFKPSSGRTNSDYESSVEEALCFGRTPVPGQVRCRQHHPKDQ